MVGLAEVSQHDPRPPPLPLSLLLLPSISNATYRCKGNRITLSLTKASEFTWYELAKKK